MSDIRVPTLSQATPIVDGQGNPSPQFVQWFNNAIGQLVSGLNGVIQAQETANAAQTTADSALPIVAAEPVTATTYGYRVAVGTARFTFDTGLQIGGAVPGYGSYGTMLRCDGHRDWITLMPRPDDVNNVNAVELALNGGTPGTYTAVGSAVTFTSGKLPQGATRIVLEEGIYPITSIAADGLSCVVTGTPDAAGVWVYAPTRGTGTCSVVGNTVTRIEGDPFIGFTSSPFVFRINGVAYTVSDSTGWPDVYVLSSAPGDIDSIGYEFIQTINDQISTFRVARLWGGNEENVSLYARYDGYWLHTLYGGVGSYRKLIIGSGESTPGTLARQIICQKNGDLSLCGDYGYEAVRILNTTGAVNRLETQAAGTGTSPSFRARGSDTDVGLTYSVQGTGSHLFTANGFASVSLQLFGTNAPDYLTLDAGTGVIPLAAYGTSANIDIKPIPKGVGRLWVGPYTAGAPAATGYIEVKDASGATRQVLCA